MNENQSPLVPAGLPGFSAKDINVRPIDGLTVGGMTGSYSSPPIVGTTFSYDPALSKQFNAELNTIISSYNPDEGKPLSQVIRSRIQSEKARFNANDNISKFIKEGEIPKLVDEVTEKFQGVLESLIIDVDNDPNSHNTARRLAKMYVYELMAGRYEPSPNVTAFPNEGKERFEGMLVVRAELISMCSHHHQPVKGTAIIGIIPTGEVIGLSKYARIAQWCARRGTLQEDLANQIAKEIMTATDTENCAVYIQATHGCMENRGVMAHSSLTQTTVVHGLFHNDSVKAEFMSNVKLQFASMRD